MRKTQYILRQDVSVLDGGLHRQTETESDSHLRRSAGGPRLSMTTENLSPARCTPPSSPLQNHTDRPAVVGNHVHKGLLPGRQNVQSTFLATNLLKFPQRWLRKRQTYK